MELLDALASAATLAQLSSKGLGFLLDITEIQGQFSELCDEITFIERTVQEIMNGHGRAVGEKLAVETNRQGFIRQVIETLKDIATDLAKIKRKCERQAASNSNSLEARKRTWITQSGKIANLLQKAQKAKSNLQLALHSDTLQYSGEIVEQQNQIVKQHIQMGERMAAIERLLTSLNEFQPEIRGFMVSMESRLPRVPQPEDLARVQELDSMNDKDPPPNHSVAQDSRAAFRASEAHAGLGSCWELGKSGIVSPRREVCGSLGAYAAKRRTCTSSGSHLKDHGVLPRSDSLWGILEQPVENFQMVMCQGTVVFPDDRRQDGGGIIDHIISLKAYEILEVLLQKWVNILPRQGLSRGDAFALTRSLFFTTGNGLGEQGARIWRRVAPFVVDGLDPETTVLHEAARRGVGMEEAFEELGSAALHLIDELDSSGMAPLHAAVLCRNVDAVQALLDAGADVNCKEGIREWTPLMEAISINETACVRALLNSGSCSIEEQANNGSTALHWAAHFGHLDSVRLLLRAGARASSRNFGGRTPLHILVKSVYADPDTMEAIARLLLQAKDVDIDAQDNSGWTPAWMTVREGKAAPLPWLIKAGASIAMVDNQSQTLLHHLACYSCLDVLDIVLSQDLPFIDTEIRDQWGHTAWDWFVFCNYAETWKLGYFFRPNSATRSAFVKLYQSIRDRSLRHDISNLQQAQEALLIDDAYTARVHLTSLSKHKADCHNHDSAAFYRAIEKSIQADGRDGGMAAIEEELQELKDRLNTSPWDQHSRYDYLAPVAQWPSRAMDQINFGQMDNMFPPSPAFFGLGITLPLPQPPDLTHQSLIRNGIRVLSATKVPSKFQN
ncbi:hypothetical protein NM208_g684 [Fusarium decemcellulare]|uniref:Uncharacterized protein n=1 Tax=Fusarium decemcellulare TaxID=57161 RepID=A0ACC1SZB8_9HYPO|nr:hypothetical protein NM208_g684 [Fusarium decemcellulare]